MLHSEDTARLIDRLSQIAPVHGETARQNRSVVKLTALPFYSSHRLVRVTVSLRERPIVFEALDSGLGMVLLSGRAEDIYSVNEREDLVLSQAQVAPYLRFFFDHLRDGELEIVEQADELRWPRSPLQASELAQREQAAQLVTPLEIGTSETGFVVQACAMLRRALVRVTIGLSPKGWVEVKGYASLAEQLPFALRAR